jgi:hypothetical protein
MGATITYGRAPAVNMGIRQAAGRRYKIPTRRPSAVGSAFNSFW